MHPIDLNLSSFFGGGVLIDQRWLELINEERKKNGDPGVPDLVFELVMDRLEKEWFSLVS